MKLYTRIIAVLLCISYLFSLCSCNIDGLGGSSNEVVAPSGSDFWGKPESESSTDNLWNADLTPNINVTVIGGDQKDDDIQSEINEGIVDSIYSLICSSVTKDLEEEGFLCAMGVASTIENDNYSALGIYYHNTEFAMFEENSNLEAVGFVEIISEDENNYNPSLEESVIMVTDVSSMIPRTTNDLDTRKVCVYNFENIGSYHFVYQNKYVTYYQETPMQIVYSVEDNVRDNYDLQLGSLYDYDNQQYLYDESIFEEYNNHSAIELFGEEDYVKLEAELKLLSDKQMANGYIVSEFNIVYISPESIQAYLSSKEEATFFGYNVEELTKAFGLGTALTFNGSGFEQAQIISDDDEYNWKSFLIKCGVGCGIVLVGAVLTPLTGGASFGCALLTISKVSLSFALTSSLSVLAIETTVGIIQGQSIDDALEYASHKGLDSFADSFMIGAVIASVGVVTGLIKPKACFVSGTPIALGNGMYTLIDNISVNDYVLSYNEETKQVSLQRVTEVFEKKVNQTLILTIGDSKIETTLNHPFYSMTYEGWVEAISLNVGDYVLSSDGTIRIVKNIEYIEHTCAVDVYNFTVESNHNYFVGEDEILVHNECTSLGAQRQQAVRDAWKNEQQAVSNGTSKYKWTYAQKIELELRGKISGYEGHHMIPVNKLVNTAKNHLISDPRNIVFLSTDAHKWVHAVGDSFVGTAPRVVKLVPWAAKRMVQLMVFP